MLTFAALFTGPLFSLIKQVLIGIIKKLPWWWLLGHKQFFFLFLRRIISIRFLNKYNHDDFDEQNLSTPNVILEIVLQFDIVNEWKVRTYFKLSTNENFCKNVDLLLLCSDSIIEITGFTSLWNKIIFVHLGSCVCAFQRLYEISQNFQRKILKLPFTSGSISAKNESSVGNA